MARFNRALAYARQNDHEAAQRDLEAVLSQADAPANIQSAAKEKLTRWEKRRPKPE